MYLQMLENADLVNLSNSFEYNSKYSLDKLFMTQKTDNLMVEAERFMEGSNIPVMAQVHSFDSEARIGDRPSYEKIKLEKLFIKEKINQTERLMYLIRDRGVQESKIKEFIFDDAYNMATRVATATSVKNAELLSTGKLVIKENNVDITVDYGMPSGNIISLTDWSNPTHDILNDIETLQSTAKSKGYTIMRAICSTKVLNYLSKNNAIKSIFSSKGDYATNETLKTWLKDKFKIEFVTNDEVYKTAINSEVKRVFKDDTITFLTTDGMVGAGLYGVTPEEIQLNTKITGNIAITQYKVIDPVAVWTKASALYLPIVKDINGLFIGNIS